MKSNVERRFLKNISLFFLLTGWAFQLVAQEEAEHTVDNRPVKNMFESIWIIEDQTVVVPYKGTFEFDIQHRFGLVKNGYEDLFGLYAPSNIRLGFGYVPFENLMIGFGIAKANLTWDLNAKYAIMQQSRSGGTPLSITYYVNAAIDTRDKGFFTNPDALVTADRISYFHELMVARKFTDKLSVQVAGSLSHFNTVDAVKTPENTVVDRWKNDHIAVALAARYKFAPWISVIADYDQPVTQHEILNPQPNISFGVELTTSAHQFQIFVSNYNSLVPQRNNVFNNNNFGDGDILIGFNMTRLWNF